MGDCNPVTIVSVLTIARWDVNRGVEEVMRGLHALIMAKQVLYLGASDMPAWVVVKANACKILHLLSIIDPD